MPSIAREEKHDVIVVGGGPAGICAAIALARLGADTLLVERRDVLGGMASSAMFQPWRGFHTIGKQLVTGIAQEIVERLQSAGGCLGHLIDKTGVSFTVTPFDARMLQSTMKAIAVEHNVRVLLHSEFLKVKISDKHITSIEIRSDGGNASLFADSFIDATGNGAVTVNAGVKFLRHETNPSYRFSMANVDENALLEYAGKHPHEFSGSTSFNEGEYVSLKGFTSLTKRWLEQSPGLSRFDSIHIDGTVRKGEVVVSMISLPNVDASDGESLMRADIRCQQLVSKGADFLRENCPGFSVAEISGTARQVGFHASVQVCGKVTISDSDVMSGNSFDDAVATCAMPGRPGCTFQVPRRALCLPEFDNLLVTGRAIFPPTALFSTNAQPASMQLGETAGKIAAQMVAHSRIIGSK